MSGTLPVPPSQPPRIQETRFTVAPYKAASSPFEFGSARITIPVDGFTFDPAQTVPTRTLGGSIDASPTWSREQAVVDVSRNAGDCMLHMGGRYDSHLLVPLRHLVSAAPNS